MPAKKIDKHAVLNKAQGVGLNLLSRFASSELPERLRLTQPIEQFLYEGSKRTFKFVSDHNKKNKRDDKVLTPEQIAKKKQGLFDLSLSDEQTMVRDNLHRFATDLIRPVAESADHDHQTPEDISQQAAALGLMYYAVPEQFGGMDAEEATVTQMLALEDLGFGDMGIAMSLFSTVAVANTIRRFGTDTQRSQYLPLLVAEESPLQAALAVNEPTPLFDPYQLACSATLSNGIYTLSGSKSLVINAEQADFYIVAANYKGKPDLFIVDAEANNLSIEHSRPMGIKAAQTATLVLDKVKVLEKDRLTADYRQFIDLSHLAVASLACGVGDAILDYVIPYVNEREAFGEPISHRQGVAFMVSNLKIELDAVRMLVWRAVALADKGKPFHREAHLAYVLASDKMMQLGSDAVQLLGGHGYTKEHPVERWYRDLSCVAVLHGSLCL